MEETSINETNRDLEKERIGKLMLKYSVPCIISLLVGALYNVVDQIFIANASYLGAYGNSASTVVFPLTVIPLSIAVMIGDGCCAYSGFSLGMKWPERAKRSVGNSIVMVIAVSIVITIVYLIAADPLIAMFGGTVNDETFQLSQEYFFIITLGVPFYMFGQAINSIIRADGNPRFAMLTTLSGAAVNIILDPVCIYGLHWGMRGAALATITGQILVAFISLWYIFHMKIIKPSLPDLKPNYRICLKTLSFGLTSFLAQISMVFSIAAVNNMVRIYGALDPVFGQDAYSQIPMAVLGIASKFFQIVISIVVGMAAGCIPIASFNMGAGLKNRVKQLFIRLLIYEALVGLVALILVEIFPKQLIGIFGAANESSYYTEFAIKTFRIYLSMIIFACVNKACFVFIQAIGKTVMSTSLSLIREIVLGVGLALLLPVFFGLDGVLYSMPAADLLTFIVAIFLIVMVFRELNKTDSTAKVSKT